MSDNKQSPTLPHEIFLWKDISSLKFVIQFFFSLTIMAFCMFQLVKPDTNGENKNVALYWSCISGILALWMPSPSSSKPTISNNLVDVEPVSTPDTNLYLAQPSQAQPDGAIVHDNQIVKH